MFRGLVVGQELVASLYHRKAKFPEHLIGLAATAESVRSSILNETSDFLWGKGSPFEPDEVLGACGRGIFICAQCPLDLVPASFPVNLSQ